MLNVSQNSENLSKLGFVLSFTSILKSPMMKTLPYLLRYLFRRVDRLPKKVLMLELHGGLYTLTCPLVIFDGNF